MAVGKVTSVGPINEETRDRLKKYRDRHELPNYNAALKNLLDAQEGER